MRMTPHTRAVLQRFTAHPDRRWHGYDLIQSSGMPSGLLYPILKRLHQAGYLTAHQEPRTGPNGDLVYGRPRRTYYQITEAGQRAAQTEKLRDG